MVQKFILNNKRLIVIVVLLTTIYYFLLSPVLGILSVSKSLQSKITPIKSALKSQDIELLVFELEYFREDLVILDKNVSRLQYLKSIPVAGDYISDLKILSSLSIQTTDLGLDLFTSLDGSLPDVEFSFKGWGTTEDLDTEKSAYDDITQLTSFISGEFKNYRDELISINEELSKIDASRYPEEFRGIKVRAKILEIQSLSSAIVLLYDDIGNYSSLVSDLFTLNLAQDLLGDTETKDYLILLQNSDEIKANAGPVSVYAVLSAKKGNFKVTRSGDVKILDNQTNSNIASSIISDDFSVSAENIGREWTKATGVSPNGIVVVDAHFIKSLIDIFGEVKVSGTSTVTSTNVKEYLDKFDAAAGTHSEETASDKAEASTLLFTLMRESLTSNANRTEFFKTLLEEIDSGHVAIYSFNPEVEDLLIKYDLAR